MIHVRTNSSDFRPHVHVHNSACELKRLPNSSAMYFHCDDFHQSPLNTPRHRRPFHANMPIPQSHLIQQPSSAPQTPSPTSQAIQPIAGRDIPRIKARVSIHLDTSLHPVQLSTRAESNPSASATEESGSGKAQLGCDVQQQHVPALRQVHFPRSEPGLQTLVRSPFVSRWRVLAAEARRRGSLCVSGATRGGRVGLRAVLPAGERASWGGGSEG